MDGSSKAKTPTAPCKLCGTKATLQWSHIVPNWTYRRLIAGNRPGTPASPVRVEGEIAIASPKQDAEYMLCRQCEELIAGSETYVASIALQGNDTFPALAAATILQTAPDPEWRVADVSTLDTDKIARFAVSVVWRASVSELYSNLNLGAKHDAILGDYLLAKTEFPAEARLLVEFMRPTRRPRVDRMVVAPETKRDGGFDVSQFCMFGMWFRLFVGDGIPANVIDPLSFVDTKRVLVSDGSRLFAAVAPKAKAATPKGRLAKK